MNIKYKISGLERRILKKELSKLKHFYKNFWHFHRLEKDMYIMYGGAKGNLVDDEKAKKIYQETSKKILKLENTLKEVEELGQ